MHIPPWLWFRNPLARRRSSHSDVSSSVPLSLSLSTLYSASTGRITVVPFATGGKISTFKESVGQKAAMTTRSSTSTLLPFLTIPSAEYEAVFNLWATIGGGNISWCLLHVTEIIPRLTEPSCGPFQGRFVVFPTAGWYAWKKPLRMTVQPPPDRSLISRDLPMRDLEIWPESGLSRRAFIIGVNKSSEG